MDSVCVIWGSLKYSGEHSGAFRDGLEFLSCKNKVLFGESRAKKPERSHRAACSVLWSHTQFSKKLLACPWTQVYLRINQTRALGWQCLLYETCTIDNTTNERGNIDRNPRVFLLYLQRQSEIGSWTGRLNKSKNPVGQGGGDWFAGWKLGETCRTQRQSAGRTLSCSWGSLSLFQAGLRLIWWGPPTRGGESALLTSSRIKALITSKKTSPRKQPE